MILLHPMNLFLFQRSGDPVPVFITVAISIVLASTLLQPVDARVIVINRLSGPITAKTWSVATSVIAGVAEIATLAILCLAVYRLLQIHRTRRGQEKGLSDGMQEVQRLSEKTLRMYWTTFASLLILSPLFLAIYYPLYIVQMLSPFYIEKLSEDASSMAGLYGMVGLASNLTDLSTGGMLLILLYHHHHMHFQEGFSAWKNLSDSILAIGMFGITLVEISFSFRKTTYETPDKLDTVNNIHHVFIGLYFILISDVFISAYLLRKKMGDHEVNDGMISGLYFSYVALLIPQAIFRVLFEILGTLTDASINIHALQFMDTLIKGISYTATLFIIAYPSFDLYAWESPLEDD